MESRKIKILAISDNQDNLISIKALIKNKFSDALILTALSDTKGIELAIENDPDVILLDIAIPEMDGIEVCKKLKADKKLSNIPVIYVTAGTGDKVSRISALECGADTFLAKPIDESELTAQIRAMVKIKNAYIQNHTEKERLEALVIKRTRELKKINDATMNLVEDLRRENEARKRSEQTLRDSEEHFRAVAQSAVDAIISINSKGIIIGWNRGAEKIFGYTEQEITGKKTDIIMPQNYTKQHHEGMHRAVRGGEHHVIGRTVELIGLHKNGNEIPVELSLAEWETYSGKFFTGIIRDITGRRHFEDELLKSTEFLKEAQEVANLGTYSFDILNNKWVSSELLDQIFGIDAEADKSMEGWVSIIHPEWKKIMNDYFINEVLGTKTKFDKEYKIIRKCDQVERWVRGMGSLKFNKNGRPIMMVGTIQDITSQKKAEEELIIAKELAEENDRLKTAFLANMSHEIRTPMNGILGFAELLKEPKLTGEEQQEYIHIIEKSGARMLNIINDIINISKIESGQMKVSISPVKVNEMIDYILIFFRPEAEQKGLQLICTKPVLSDETILYSDREKLYTILTNLVKNAIKYCDNGTIELGYTIGSTNAETSRNQSLKNNSSLCFFIKDTGIGIPEDRQAIVFERFVQADIGDKRAFQGAGLGLSISKAFVEMLGGEIWMESKEGNGSVFYFTIPTDNKEKGKDNSENLYSNRSPHESKNLKILIVEDDKTSELLISMVVRTVGKEILKADTGLAAIEACRKHPDIDLILMDVKMPEMDGYEAARQIRQFNKKTVIIAQTAYALTGEQEKAITAGCNDYISKPIQKDQLKRLINKYFDKH